MAVTILQINFNFDGSWAGYEAANAPGARQIATAPGLGWKGWLKNAATGEADPINLFHDQAAAQVAVMLADLWNQVVSSVVHRQVTG